MQAALMIRSKKRVARRKRLRKEGRLYDLPSNVSVKQLQPFPSYPPDQWVGDLDTSVKCAQGRAAWLERGRRCSVQENAASSHRRWVKRNRIQDSSLGGSSDDDDFLGVLRGPSSFANAFLYVGLGTMAIGLVIAFVGTGEKGFKTVELRLIGPTLFVIGLVCCILRILFCICPSNCMSSKRKKLKQKNAKIDADHTTSLLQSNGKRVAISRSIQQKSQQSLSKLGKQAPSIKMIEGMEALRQIASTSLFLENEQHNRENNRIVPVIKEPDKDSPLEMRTLNDANIEICSISDDDEEFELGLATKPTKCEPSNSLHIDLGQQSILPAAFASTSTAYVRGTEASETSIQLQQQRPNKLLRTRAPVIQAKPKDDDLILIETSLMILDESPRHSSRINQPSTSAQANIPITSSSSPTANPSYATQYNMASTLGVASTSSGIPNSSQSLFPYFPSTSSILQPSTSKYARDAAPIMQDGSAMLTMVQPANGSVSTSTTEPELVLSPANLGQ